MRLVSGIILHRRVEFGRRLSKGQKFYPNPFAVANVGLATPSSIGVYRPYLWFTMATSISLPMRALRDPLRQHFQWVVAVRGNETCRDPSGIVFTRVFAWKFWTERNQNVNWHHNLQWGFHIFCANTWTVQDRRVSISNRLHCLSNSGNFGGFRWNSHHSIRLNDHQNFNMESRTTISGLLAHMVWNRLYMAWNLTRMKERGQFFAESGYSYRFGLHRHRPKIEKVGSDGSHGEPKVTMARNCRFPDLETYGSQPGTRGYHCKELPVPRS